MDTWVVFIGLAILVTLATDIILVTFISRGILVPLDKLRRATHEIRDGNLDYRVDYEGKNELGDVCADFDEMRLRLRDSVKSQQRYEDNRKELLAGISHDLSTPLTAIKGYVSGLIDGIADTPEKQAHYLKTIYSTACDMDNLVSELFTFSNWIWIESPSILSRWISLDFLRTAAMNYSRNLQRRKRKSILTTNAPLLPIRALTACR